MPHYWDAAPPSLTGGDKLWPLQHGKAAQTLLSPQHSPSSSRTTHKPQVRCTHPANTNPSGWAVENPLPPPKKNTTSHPKHCLVFPIPLPICNVPNQELGKPDPVVQLISMEMYAAHKQTGARLIRATPLIHRQPPACTSPGLFLGHFTKQMYLIKKRDP